MASRRSSIGAQLHLDKRGFKAALDSAKNDAQAWKSGVEAMKLKRGALTGEGVGIGKWTELNSKLQVVGGGLRMAGGAAAGFAKSMIQGELSFEALLRGLASTSDESETLRAELEALQEVAKMPGLGFREAIQGATALKGAKLSAMEAREALVAFGNALTNAGRTKADLFEVIRAIEGIISTKSVSDDKLDVLAGRIPGFLDMAARVPKDNVRDWVRGVIKELQKLPKAAESGQDAIDNLQDGIDQTKLGLTDGNAVEAAAKYANTVGGLLKGNVDVGALMKAWDDVKDAPELIEKYQPSEQELARRKKMREEREAAEKEQKEAAESAAKRAKEEEAAARLKATAPQREAAMEELAVLRLRAAGQNKKADELQRQQEMRKRSKELQEAGMPAAQADAVAGEESQLKKDMAAGRRRTYKGESATGFRGLAANRELAEKMDRRSLNEEWVFPGLDSLKAMQSKNTLKPQASARASGAANAAAGDPVSKAVTFFGPEIVKKLDIIAASLTPLAPLPATKLP